MTGRGLLPLGIALAFFLWNGVAMAAMVDITRPGDPLLRVDGMGDNDGKDGDPPGNEGVEHAIDDIGQKYLNFKDLGSGFAVTPSANPLSLPVVGLRLYTANDAVERDPTSYVLEGSNDADLASASWTLIAADELALPAGRNAGGSSVSIPPTGNLAAFQQTVTFSNATAFAHYRLTFPTLVDAGNEVAMQIGEVELLVVPEPASLALLVLGLVYAAKRGSRSDR